MDWHPACDRRQAAGDVVSDIAEDLPDQRALSGFLWLDRATVMIHQVLDAAAQRVSQGRVAHDQIGLEIQKQPQRIEVAGADSRARQSIEEGKSVSVSEGHGGRRNIKKKKKNLK